MLTARPLGAGKGGFDFVVGQRQAAGDGDAIRQTGSKTSSIAQPMAGYVN